MEQLEKIIKYLDGEVIGDEKQLFESEIENNLALKQSLLLVQEVDRTIANDELFFYFEKLQKAQAIVDKEDDTLSIPKRTSSLKTIWFNRKFIAAASVTIILGISALFYRNYTNPSNDRVFTKFYQRYEADLLTRSAGTSDVNDQIQAIQLYNNGSYEKAIGHFKQILNNDRTNTAAHFFIGVTYMEAKEYTKAIEDLAYVSSQKDSAFIEHAEWYLALCYIKTNQNNRAALVLNKIANGKTYYRKTALDVLQKLK